MRGILITGTGTGIGKTFITCGLAAALSQRGIRVGVMKPIETGCKEQNGILAPADAIQLKFFSKCKSPIEIISPCRYRAPRAPWVAALEEGQEVDISLLEKTYQGISSNHDLTLVEGAGGIMVPIHKDFNFADLAQKWGLSVVLVTTAKLGTLNQTLLSLEYLHSKNLNVLGYVVNTHEHTPSDLVSSNLSAFERLVCEPFLGQVPHQDYQEIFSPQHTDPDHLASIFNNYLRWDKIEALTTAREGNH